MAITVVQTKTGTSSTGSSLSITLTSTTAGNTVVVAIAGYLSTTGVNPVSQVKLGTASMNNAVANEDTATLVDNEIWWIDNIAAGQTTVTVTWLGSQTAGAAVAYEISGLNPAGSLDKTNATDLDTATTPASWTSNATATLSQASEIAIGCSSQQNVTTITGPSSPWVNTNAGTTVHCEAGTNIVSATTGLAYAGSTTHSGTIHTATCIATFKALTNVSVALTTAQETISAPAPSTGAGPLALSVAQVNEAALPVAPVINVNVALSVAQVNVSALPPAPQMSGVSLPVALESVSAPAVTPTIGIVVALPAAQVTLSAPAPGLSGIGVALTTAAVTAAAPAPGLSIGKNVNLTVAAETISAPPPTPHVNVSVSLTTAQVTISARPPKPSRQLLIALASASGTDDYGNGFPQGILATAGVIEGPTIIGSDAFFYDPSPGFGNLTQSITEADGTDQYGNAWIAGTATYTDNGSFWSAVVIAGGVVTWYMATGPGGPWTAEAGIGFSWNNLTGGGLNFSGPAGNDMTGDLNVSGSITVTTSLVVAGTDVGSALNAIQSALSGASTSTNGLADGTIHGTSGGASTGTAHTHGPGSFAVGSGQHSHTLPTF